jgi:hypothetical protein
MDLVAIAGKVSHLNRVSSITGGGGAAVETEHETTFRVNGRHVVVGDAVTWASDGDHVAIVGTETDGVLEPLAVRNDTSGYEGYAEARSYTFAIVLLFLGVFTFFITTAIGAWLIWGIARQKRINAEARRRLNSIPRAAAVSAAS